METYTYTGKITQPDLDAIQFTDIPASEMTDKDIDSCDWSEDDAELHIIFNAALSAGDKTILDGIVADNS